MHMWCCSYRNKTSSAALPTDGGAKAVPNIYESSVQNQPVVGGTMKYKCKYTYMCENLHVTDIECILKNLIY